MSNALVPVQRNARQLLRRARELAEEDLAPNTRRTYASGWRDFAAFCALKRIGEPLPSSPAAVVSYVTFLAEEARQKVTTIRTRLAAIRYFHLQARLADPTADPAVERVLGGISRTYGTPPDRKAGINFDDLGAMLDAQPPTLAGTRNRAMLLLAYAADLRRSELVALQVADVEFQSDRVVVKIQRSKTDQSGEGYAIHVPRMADRRVDPVRALRTWLMVAQTRSGPLFRKVDRWEHVGEKALTDQVVADIVKSAAVAVGLERKFYSGHSLRRGGISQASRNREGSLAIRQVSRHKTERMVDVYVTEAADTQMRVIAGALGQKQED